VRRAALAVAWLAGAALGCGSATPVTEVVLVVSSELSAPDEIDQVTFTVAGKTTMAAATGPKSFPMTLALVYRGGPMGPHDVDVVGTLASAQVAHETTSITFVRDKTLRPKLTLRRSAPSDAGTPDAAAPDGPRAVPPDTAAFEAPPGDRPPPPAERTPDAPAPDGPAATPDMGSAPDRTPDAVCPGPRMCGTGAQGCVCTTGCGCGALTCAPKTSCDVTCKDPGNGCGVTAAGATGVTIDCASGTGCLVNGKMAMTLELVCRGGATCAVDCTDANGCNLACEDTAKCSIKCMGARNCLLSRCNADFHMCPNGVFTCGMACP
jgi:hypothetical protein